MKFIEEFTIETAIIHVMDTNLNKPILATNVLELNEKTYKFILKHIKSCIRNKKIKSSFFKENSRMKGILTKDLLNGKEFIETSISIANDIFGFLVNEDKNSSDLLVALIATDIGKFWVILNLNYHSIFTHTIHKEDDKTNVIISESTEGLPQQSSKVSKAAFIQCSGKGDYDVFILEKNATSKELPWFSEKFLECNIVNSDRDNANKIVRAIEKFACLISGEKPSLASIFRKAAKESLTVSPNLDVEKVAGNILPSEELSDFLELCKNQNIDTTNIKIDSEYIKKELEIKKIKIDKDITLSITRQAYNDASKFQIKENADGSICMILKNIRKYQEK